jgi:hypothetical protein
MMNRPLKPGELPLARATFYPHGDGVIELDVVGIRLADVDEGVVTLSFFTTECNHEPCGYGYEFDVSAADAKVLEEFLIEAADRALAAPVVDALDMAQVTARPDRPSSPAVRKEADFDAIP